MFRFFPYILKNRFTTFNESFTILWCWQPPPTDGDGDIDGPAVVVVCAVACVALHHRLLLTITSWWLLINVIRHQLMFVFLAFSSHSHPGGSLCNSTSAQKFFDLTIGWSCDLPS